jgi:hypothetical protein
VCGWDGDGSPGWRQVHMPLEMWQSRSLSVCTFTSAPQAVREADLLIGYVRQSPSKPVFSKHGDLSLRTKCSKMPTAVLGKSKFSI